jgi:chromate transport protein ChrA
MFGISFLTEEIWVAVAIVFAIILIALYGFFKKKEGADDDIMLDALISMLLVLFSLIWPVAIMFAALGLVVYIPQTLGKYFYVWNEKRKREKMDKIKNMSDIEKVLQEKW